MLFCGFAFVLCSVVAVSRLLVGAEIHSNRDPNQPKIDPKSTKSGPGGTPQEVKKRGNQKMRGGVQLAEKVGERCLRQHSAPKVLSPGEEVGGGVNPSSNIESIGWRSWRDGCCHASPKPPVAQRAGGILGGIQFSGYRPLGPRLRLG